MNALNLSSPATDQRTALNLAAKDTDQTTALAVMPGKAKPAAKTANAKPAKKGRK